MLVIALVITAVLEVQTAACVVIQTVSIAVILLIVSLVTIMI